MPRADKTEKSQSSIHVLFLTFVLICTLKTNCNLASTSLTLFLPFPPVQLARRERDSIQKQETVHKRNKRVSSLIKALARLSSYYYFIYSIVLTLSHPHSCPLET